jgi:hypothetical protein
MHCEDNGKYIQQAVDCQKRFRSDIGLFAQALKVSLSGNTGAKQNQNFSAAVSDYHFSTGQLDFLILLAEQAKTDVSSYKNWVVQPEDIDNPDIAPDPEAFARSVPCYHETLQALEAVGKSFDSMKNDLLVAKRAAELAGRVASFQMDQLKNSGSLSIDALIQSSRGDPPLSAPRAGGQNVDKKESDVTGQKKLETPKR